MSLGDGELVMGLRVAGASQIVLGLGHILLWRLFQWTREIAALSPLTARVFAVHTFFIAFVLVAAGALGVVRPDLLLARGDLSRFLLGTSVVFWTLRLAAQPLVFDPVLLRGSAYRPWIRGAATLLFLGYVLLYAWAFARQAP